MVGDDVREVVNSGGVMEARMMPKDRSKLEG